MSSGLSRRRVEGLRREEVAMAAGISLDYYTRVEQGRVEDIPPDILNSLAQVLQLTAEQTRELHHPLITPTIGSIVLQRAAEQTARELLQFSHRH